MREFKKSTDNYRIKEYFSKAKSCGKLSHAYIINGAGQERKKELAELIAGSVLCAENPSVTDGPCGKCPYCIKVLTDNHPDLIWVKGEKKGLLSVDDIRKQVVADIHIKPYYGKHKLYIIENAEQMTVNAQNALLKTIEEPPVYVTIFLLTENSDVFLDTIRSRCIKLDMEKIPADTSGEQYIFWIDFLKQADRVKFTEIVALAASLDKKDNLAELEIIRMWFRDVLLYKSGVRDGLFFEQEKNAIAGMAGQMSYESINSVLEEINITQSRIKASVNKPAAMECMLLNIRRNIKEKEKEKW